MCERDAWAVVIECVGSGMVKRWRLTRHPEANGFNGSTRGGGALVRFLCKACKIHKRIRCTSSRFKVRGIFSSLSSFHIISSASSSTTLSRARKNCSTGSVRSIGGLRVVLPCGVECCPAREVDIESEEALGNVRGGDDGGSGDAPSEAAVQADDKLGMESEVVGERKNGGVAFLVLAPSVTTRVAS